MENIPLTIWPLELARTAHCFSPKLANAITSIFISPINYYHPIYDMGCGKGEYLKALQDKGYNGPLLGIEGTEEIKEIAVFDNIIVKDLSKNIDPFISGNVICLEVAEHILPEYEDIFVKNLIKNLNYYGLLIISWAIPGQPGDGHNNCRDNKYVYDLFTKTHNLSLDADLTFFLRSNVDDNCPWFRNTLFVFRRI